MSKTDTSMKFNFIYSLRLAFLYTVAKLKFIHPLLPESLTEELPTGWNGEMFWTAFMSGGERFYYDYYCEYKQPQNYLPKAPVAPEFQLSEQDIQSFHENGFIGPFDLVSPEEMAELRQHFFDSVITSKSPQSQSGQFKQGHIAQSLLPSTADTRSKDIKDYMTKRFGTLSNRHLDDEKLRSLLSRPALVERCAQLLGPDLLLWRSTLFPVNRQTKGTQFHQNSTWLYQNARNSVINPSDSSELFNLTCWVAITDVREENGAMVMLPGTQRKIYPLRAIKKDDDNSVDLRVYGNNHMRELDYPIEQAKKVKLEMKAGQFFIFSERVIHGSTDNTTDFPRWAVSCRLVKPDTRIYTKEMLERGHQEAYYNIKNYSLDSWSAVLVRGEDRFGYNRLFKRESKPKVEKLC